MSLILQVLYETQLYVEEQALQQQFAELNALHPKTVMRTKVRAYVLWACGEQGAVGRRGRWAYNTAATLPIPCCWLTCACR